jgi:hypothetical protein
MFPYLSPVAIKKWHTLRKVYSIYCLCTVLQWLIQLASKFYTIQNKHDMQRPALVISVLQLH